MGLDGCFGRKRQVTDDTGEGHRNRLFSTCSKSIRVAGATKAWVRLSSWWKAKTTIVLWERFFPKQNCELFYADGKCNITAALDNINDRGEAGVTGIVDADYWLITESDKLHQKNLLYDQCYPDAELMILNSATLADVLKTKFLPQRRSGHTETCLLTTDEAERLAMEFGYFRLLNDCKCYGISFKEFWKSCRYDFEEFVDAEEIDSIQFRRDCFAKRLADFHNARKSLGHYKRIEQEELLAGVVKLKEIDKYRTPNIQLCQGHDTIAIIAYLLPIMFKSSVWT